MPPDVSGLSRPELEQLALSQWAKLEKMESEIAEIKRLLFGQRRERFLPEKMPTMARALRHRQPDDDTAALARRLRAKEKRAEHALKKKALPVVEVSHPI